MKFIGIIFIICSGVLCSFGIKMSYRKRIEMIEEFIKNLEIMSNQIYFYKMNICDLLTYLYSSSQNQLKIFYKSVMEYLEKDGVEKAFEKSLPYLTGGFSIKDKKLIMEFAGNLGNSDYKTQLNNIEATKALFKYELDEARNNRDRNEKAKSTLVMSGFIMLALILI